MVRTNQIIRTSAGLVQHISLTPHFLTNRHLIERDYNLEWSATNAHFVAGMLGFLVLVAIRMYFHAEGGLLGMGIAGIPLSALLLMIAIVNRGVARGSGDGHRYGSDISDLFSTYGKLLIQRACNKSCVGILEIGSILLLLWSLGATVKGVATRFDLGESKKNN